LLVRVVVLHQLQQALGGGAAKLPRKLLVEMSTFAISDKEKAARMTTVPTDFSKGVEAAMKAAGGGA
jgi:hypothetical protein